MKTKLLKLLPAALAVVLLLIVETVFMLKLKSTALLPTKYMALLGLGLLLLTALCGFLMVSWKRLWCFIPGALLTVLVTTLLLMGLNYVQQGVDTILRVIQPDAATSAVDIVVRKDDPAKDIFGAKDYTFGILEVIDRENSNKAAEKVGEELGVQIRVETYENINVLIGALLKTKEIDAVILNDGFWLMLQDMELEQEIPEAERLVQTTRVLHVVHVEEQLPPVTEPPVTTAPPDEDKLPVFTVYISGSDSRYGLNYRSNSDVNILAVVNPNTRQVLLISTPRDYYIPLSISNGAKDKLTHAGIYGVEVSMDTLSMLYSTSVEYYLKVNFAGFESIVDALGGITVYSEVAFTAENVRFHKGENFVNGKEALIFARERKSFATGDRQRGENQMQVIRGAINKMLSPAILSNFSGVMKSLEKSFAMNVPYELISTLVRDQLENGGSWEIISYSVDGSDDEKPTYTHPSDTYVMVPYEADVNQAKALLAAMKRGDRISQP